MATGVQTTDSKSLTTVRLAEGLQAASSVPTGPPLAVPLLATDGFLLSALGSGSSFNLAEPGGGFRFTRGVGVRIYSTAGATVASLAAPGNRLWTYSLASAVWSPFGIGAGESAAGLLNGGLPIEEVAAGVIRFHEWINQMLLADGVFVQTGTPAGAGLTWNVEIDFPRIARD
jgi:hypothetical protein